MERSSGTGRGGGCAQLQARFSEVLTVHTLPTGLQPSPAQPHPEPSQTHLVAVCENACHLGNLAECLPGASRGPPQGQWSNSSREKCFVTWFWLPLQLHSPPALCHNTKPGGGNAHRVPNKLIWAADCSCAGDAFRSDLEDCLSPLLALGCDNDYAGQSEPILGLPPR